jgi:hypothetical protein
MAALLYRGRSAITNSIPSSDDNARQQYPGENHALLKLENGKTGIANYMGPGTQIEKRIAKADPPRTLADKTAQAHDIRYAEATTAPEIRQADKKMVNTLKRIKKNRSDSRFNILQGMKLIQAKMKLEDAGVLSKGSFGDIGKPKPPISNLMVDKLEDLEQQGFGNADAVDAISELKKKMAKFAKKK